MGLINVLYIFVFIFRMNILLFSSFSFICSAQISDIIVSLKYSNLSTPLNLCFSASIGLLLSTFHIFIISVLPLFIFNSIFPLFSSICSNMLTTISLRLAISTKLSAYATSWPPLDLIVPLFSYLCNMFYCLIEK